MQLLVNEVHLAKVGLGGVGCDPGAMLNGLTEMSVVFDPEPRDKDDAVCDVFAERVGRATADGDDKATFNWQPSPVQVFTGGHPTRSLGDSPLNDTGDGACARVSEHMN
jgi:hypothetical protein